MAINPFEARRRSFLLAVAGVAFLSALCGQTAGGKLLIVVAHPDDEYAFSAATYRLVRERGWTADQVIISDGESGYRYSALAEAVYGVTFTRQSGQLAAIRKQEAIKAGKILGIRRQYFLDQKDLGFDSDAAAAESGNWDREHLCAFLSDLLTATRYDAVFTLLPTPQAHGHHRAATILALQTVAQIPEDQRPLVLGAEPRSKAEAALAFSGLPAQPLTLTVDPSPVFVFDRTTSFGYRNALSYQIVVNWVIAEYKSQGMFQTDYGKHDLEQFWLFAVSGDDARQRAQQLQAQLSIGREHSAVH